MKANPDVGDAYALKTKSDIRDLYARWAGSYDVGFGDALGYQLPRLVTQAFLTAGGTGPVLDVGAGTGLVAEHLAHFGITPVDALDLSQDMLSVADTKGVYRHLIAADVTEPMDLQQTYDGLISAGTFTHGHVGPEAITNLINVANKGAVVALTVNLSHYESKGFEDAFQTLGPRIKDLEHRDHRIYDDRADKTRRDDVARIITFRVG